MPNERLSILSQKALNTPEKPGVYIMRNKNKEIIYIGKAKVLKNRVSQYFRAGEHHEPKVQKMVDNVFDFDYVVCTSEFEALILECSLIKQHQPKYNILLKDDKGYHYIKISKSLWPRITAEKQKNDDDAEYLGPYNSGFAVNSAVEETGRIFKLPKCNKTFSKDMKKVRPCLNYSIGLCCAPCAGKISRTEYCELIDSAADYLKNGKKQSVDALKEQMNTYAENLEFEKAAKLRDRIKAMEKVREKQHIYASRVSEQDVIAMAHSYDGACFEVFRFTDGRLFDREHYFVDYSVDEPALRGEFIKRYYTDNDRVPPQITVDGDIEDAQVLERWLSEKSGRTVRFHKPLRGEQLALVEMCRGNAAERLVVKGGKRRNTVLDELASVAGLKELPEYIEAYDISHTASSFTVGGMVVFKNGKPFRSAYRRFKIDSAAAGDDYASMEEVICRRINEYQKSENDEGFGRKPDLILLDGGRGQLMSALGAAKDKGFDVPMLGMVKDDKHKTRALVAKDGEIEIKQTRSVFTLISEIQDEVHRFSVAYHHTRRSKAMFKMKLEEIEGIGPAKAKALLEYFGSLDKIADADIDEIASVKGVTNALAFKIKKFLRGN